MSYKNKESWIVLSKHYCLHDADQYQCYWVQHTDKGRLELNFVIANVELLRGTAMTPYNHKLDKSLVSTWKDLTNLAYGLDNLMILVIFVTIGVVI